MRADSHLKTQSSDIFEVPHHGCHLRRQAPLVPQCAQLDSYHTHTAELLQRDAYKGELAHCRESGCDEDRNEAFGSPSEPPEKVGRGQA